MVIMLLVLVMLLLLLLLMMMIMLVLLVLHVSNRCCRFLRRRRLLGFGSHVETSLGARVRAEDD